MRGNSRRWFLAHLGATGVIGLAGCAGRSDDSNVAVRPGDVRVRLTGEPRFEPAEVTVESGDAVVWENEGTAPQSVTAYEDNIPITSEYFASGDFSREVAARILYPIVGALTRGEQYRHTFEVSGTYLYFSIPREDRGMQGTVIVEE